MKAYWDSSALIEATQNLPLRRRLDAEKGVMRTHSQAECFSALTGGNLAIRVDADGAVRLLEGLSADLEFVDLDIKEVLDALKTAKKRGVRGGHVHDLMHAADAEKAKVKQLLTLDTGDFQNLTTSVQISPP
jgi:predicted nucleic acid-binding protein